MFQSSWLWNWSGWIFPGRLFPDYFGIIWEFCHCWAFHGSNQLLVTFAFGFISDPKKKKNFPIISCFPVSSLDWSLSEANLGEPVKGILPNSPPDGAVASTNLNFSPEHTKLHITDLFKFPLYHRIPQLLSIFQGPWVFGTGLDVAWWKSFLSLLFLSGSFLRLFSLFWENEYHFKEKLRYLENLVSKGPEFSMPFQI